jgi:hypothetical protein
MVPAKDARRGRGAVRHKASQSLDAARIGLPAMLFRTITMQVLEQRFSSQTSFGG